MTARCSALFVLSPLGREAPPPVSFDNKKEMPVAPQLPPYTWMQEPTAVGAISCQSLFTHLLATERTELPCNLQSLCNESSGS